jgi:hypothetical protein
MLSPGLHVHHTSYLIGCGGVRSSAQQRHHHGGVPLAGRQVQRRAPILQPRTTSVFALPCLRCISVRPMCQSYSSVIVPVGAALYFMPARVVWQPWANAGQCLRRAPARMAQSTSGCTHLVHTAVDEFLPSLQELGCGGQIAVLGSIKEQARSFLLREWHVRPDSGTRAGPRQDDAPKAISSKRAPLALTPLWQSRATTARADVSCVIHLSAWLATAAAWSTREQRGNGYRVHTAYKFCCI